MRGWAMCMPLAGMRCALCLDPVPGACCAWGQLACLQLQQPDPGVHARAADRRAGGQAAQAAPQDSSPQVDGLPSRAAFEQAIELQASSSPAAQPPAAASDPAHPAPQPQVAGASSPAGSSAPAAQAGLGSAATAGAGQPGAAGPPQVAASVLQPAAEVPAAALEASTDAPPLRQPHSAPDIGSCHPASATQPAPAQHLSNGSPGALTGMLDHPSWL